MIFFLTAKTLDFLLTLAIYAILIRAILSWISPYPRLPIARFLHRLTDPLLRPIQMRLPPYSGIDFSPMIAILILFLLRHFLVGTLLDMARGM